jgi:hypothetical protein
MVGLADIFRPEPRLDALSVGQTDIFRLLL